MFCTHCGMQVRHGSAFCDECGASLSRAPGSDQPAGSTTRLETPPTAAEQPAQAEAPFLESPPSAGTDAPPEDGPTVQVESEQNPTDPLGSVVYEFGAAWRRFWGLSWWWKGPALGGVAFIALIIAGNVADREDDDNGGSFSQRTPESVAEGAVRRFYDAILDGDLAAFETELSDQMPPSDRGEFVRRFSLWQQASDSEKDQIRITGLFVRDEGEPADGLVAVDITFKDGAPDTLYLSARSGAICFRGICNLWIVDVESHDEGGTQESPTISSEKLDELLSDAETAVLVVDAFWARHWSDTFTRSYRSPDVWGGYFGSENPACGGVHENGSGNAYYCRPDDYLAWDWNLLVSQFSDEAIGDSFVYFVIAHEWGHAIQARLNSSLLSTSRELQADCLAAAALIGAADDGDLRFEPGDRGEIFESLAYVADELEWGNPADHGSADQRIEAYQAGERGGVRACFPSE